MCSSDLLFFANLVSIQRLITLVIVFLKCFQNNEFVLNFPFYEIYLLMNGNRINVPI